MSQKPRFILSDLHLGDGQSHLEDFDDSCTESFVNFFVEAAALGGVKVILNGDFIDFPQIPLEHRSEPPHKFLGTTEAESVERLENAMNGHPEEFEALKLFLSKPRNELLLIAGNHDIDFCWNRVLKLFRRRIGARNTNFHFGMVYKEPGLYVTHGHQYSHENRIDVPINFTFNRLNSCWGTFFVEQFFNQVEERYPLLDNARPTWKVALSAILHEEVLVTGEFAANFLIFLKRFGMPLNEYLGTALFGWKPQTRLRLVRQRDIESLTASVPLEELHERLGALRDDEVFQQAFDATFHELDDQEWTNLLSSSATTDQTLVSLLQETEPEAQARDIFSKTDSFQKAAKLIAAHHPGTNMVVMGHTHLSMDAKKLTVEDGDKRVWYLNTGTWTKTYDIPWWQLPRLRKLENPALFSPSSGVVRCVGTGDSLEAKYFDSWQQAL